jgi:hypothetical protein
VASRLRPEALGVRPEGELSLTQNRSFTEEIAPAPDGIPECHSGCPDETFWGDRQPAASVARRVHHLRTKGGVWLAGVTNEVGCALVDPTSSREEPTGLCNNVADILGGIRLLRWQGGLDGRPANKATGEVRQGRWTNANDDRGLILVCSEFWVFLLNKPSRGQFVIF